MSDGLVQDAVPEKTEANILKFIRKYGRVAPVEIRMVFNLSDSETEHIIKRLASKRQINVTLAGNGSFVEATANPMTCDVETGTCSL